MTDAKETWYRRDLPVLRVITQLIDDGGTVDAGSAPAVAEATGLTVEEVERSVKALVRRGVLIDTGEVALGDAFGMIETTGEAYRLVGLHPDPEADHRERVVAALEDLATRLPPEDAAAVRGVTGQVRTLSRDALAAFIAAVAAGHITA